MANLRRHRRVQRMYDGQWQWFAGLNTALGAPRWSTSEADAVLFNDNRLAQAVAHQYGAFVVLGPVREPKEA